MEEKRASLCIVTYNSSDNISEALRTITEKCADVDIFISDNNSTDGTAAAVRRDFPSVTVMENGENRGFGAGHNAVIPRLESRYHFIVNPDIILEDDAVSQMCDFFDSHPDVVMAVPKFVYEDGREQFTPKLTPTLHYMLGGRLEKFGGVFRKWRDEYTFRGKNVTDVTDVGFCSGCFIGIRTDVFRSLGGFDERYFLYSEDADLTRMAQKHGRTVYIPQIKVIHKWERAYMKSPKYFLIQISSMIKYFHKWRKDGK